MRKILHKIRTLNILSIKKRDKDMKKLVTMNKINTHKKINKNIFLQLKIQPGIILTEFIFENIDQ